MHMSNRLSDTDEEEKTTVFEIHNCDPGVQDLPKIENQSFARNTASHTD